MQIFGKQLSTNIRNFILFYIGAILIIMFSAYLVRNYREIEEYKKITLWYEKLDKSSGELSEFITQAQNKLESDFISELSNKDYKIVEGTDKKIYANNQELPKDSTNSASWKIQKTDENVTVYYDYVAASDFSGNQQNNSEPQKVKDEVVKDEVFLRFTNLITGVKIKGDNFKGDNLESFTKSVMKYLANDDKYIKSMPYFRINSIYLTNITKDENNKGRGFLLSYPLTNQQYKSGVDFTTRPWYSAAQENPKGITHVYIDINDRNAANAIRTLFYRFTNANGKTEYILCIDLFFDKSGQLLSKPSIPDSVKQYVISGFYLKENDNPWLFLMLYSFILAVLLFLVYEMKAKYILLRMLNFNGNNLSKIRVKRNPLQIHNASCNAGQIQITVTGMTTRINKSEIAREAKWTVEFTPLQINGVAMNANIQQQELAYQYEASYNFDLNITQPNLIYRRVETWTVEVHKSNELPNPPIGHFIVTWKASDTETLDELLEIKSVYWEEDHEKNYLDSIKSQLREHLLTSDAGELVPVMDTNYRIHPNIPELIAQIDSLKKFVHNSLYLKHGRIAFSDIKTLEELYRHSGVEVKAICTINFLRKIPDNDSVTGFFSSTSQRKIFYRI